MFKHYLKVFLSITFLSFSLFASGQGASNKGTDFWLGYGKHVSTGEMVVYITSDVNTTATVYVANQILQTVSVPANGIVSVDIPSSAHLANDGYSDQGIHITSLKPIIVYAHIYANSVSGATLVLPVNALGKEYLSINYKQISNSKGSVSWFFVVAVEDDTEVEITPSADTEEWPANTTHTVKLKKGEVYNVLGKFTDVPTKNSKGEDIAYSYGNDLTGSKIRSISSNGTCKKIAVFSGSSKITINCLNYSLPTTSAKIPSPGSADNLIQQAYPIDTWGKNFITVPQKERSFVVYRIVKSDPSAVVTRNNMPLTFNGLYYDFESQQVEQITSDKPIQVVQYAVSQGEGIGCTNSSGDVGDPEMIYLNPLEQTLTNITMYSTGSFKILKHFINVVIRKEGVASFTVDGNSVSSSFIAVPGNSDYFYAQLSVNEGTHNLKSDIGFNAIAYGFGTAESYGYAAGANLTAFGIDPVDAEQPSTTIQTGCVGVTYDLTLKLPYKASEIQFDSGDGLKVFNLPTSPEEIVKDGKKTYVYSLIPQITYAEAKTYSYRVVTTKPSADVCGSGDEFLFDFLINPKPVAGFTIAPEACVNNSISVVPIKIPNQRITEYLWDFGDGLPINTENAEHIYKMPGIKNVKLSVKSEDGCWSDVKELKIEVMPLPIADFKQQGATCVDGAIPFTDQSTLNQNTVARSTITKWSWDFGDPTSNSNTSTEQNPTHIFSEAKTYSVQLIVFTNLGCSDTIVKSVVVYPLPVVDFDTPDICLSDASATFTNKSTIPDGSSMTYEWNFGDTNATAINPNISTTPTHKYSRADVYQVTLTATSANGCISSLTKAFTVNGSTPKAAFVVQNKNNLCSDQPVVFEDLATIDFGEVTKIEWTFDTTNPSVVEIDNAPASKTERQLGPKTYIHQYPKFSTPLTKEVTVQMKVYSGVTCEDVVQQKISLKASPSVIFNPLAAVCAEIAPFPLTQASETTGFIGTGKYTGEGVDENGLFWPAKAGVGEHTITYAFFGTNGCSDNKTQNITVYPTPAASAGADKVILTGGTVMLDATASGSNLTYKWTPSIGLDRDDILKPSASPSKDINYTLTVKSDQGCEAKSTVFVKVLQFPEIPNTFTPNGDGVNDTWVIKYLDSYPNATIKIFNRYGNEVFSANKYVAWDGKLNGAYVPQGMYYYIITAKNGELKYNGSLLIVR